MVQSNAVIGVISATPTVSQVAKRKQKKKKKFSPKSIILKESKEKMRI